MLIAHIAAHTVHVMLNSADKITIMASMSYTAHIIHHQTLAVFIISCYKPTVLTHMV